MLVIGAGRTGLGLALALIEQGHQVVSVEQHVDALMALDRGRVPFAEPGFADALIRAQESGRFACTSDPALVLEGTDVVFVAVETTVAPDGAPTLGALELACRMIGRHVSHEILIALVSTVPVGGTRQAQVWVLDALRQTGRSDVEHLVSVARVVLRPQAGRVLEDLRGMQVLACGTDDPLCAPVLERAFEGLAGCAVMTVTEAELLGVLLDSHALVEMGFAREAAALGAALGVSWRTLAPFLGQQDIPFSLGPYLKIGAASAERAGLDSHKPLDFLSHARRALAAASEQTLVALRGEVGPLSGRRFAVWGLSSAPPSDELRGSAALETVRRLLGEGAEVSLFDPVCGESAARALGGRVAAAPTPLDAAAGADAVLVLAPWPELRHVSFASLRDQLVQPLVLDAVAILEDSSLTPHGLRYVQVGAHPGASPRTTLV